MREIKVSKEIAFVDDEDFDLVDQYHWTISRLGLQT
jgi:hypothetical protein